MKIYTKTGDGGQTGLFGGPRVSKHAIRIEAFGTVDELNAVLGVVRAVQPPPWIDQLIEQLQNELFELGAALATPSDAAETAGRITAQHVARLEGLIDLCEQELDPLRQFILPGGAPSAAHLHHARTVCRRAERHVVELAQSEPVAAEVIIYLNRLSDLLFVLARVANHRAGVPDVKWTSR